MSARKRFLMYHDWKWMIDGMTDEDLASLTRAVFNYHNWDTDPPLTYSAKIVFWFFKVTFDKDKIEYEKVVELRKEAGKKWGLAKASKWKQKLAKASKQLAKLADNGNDNDIDNVNDSDTDIHTYIFDRNFVSSLSSSNFFERFWELYPTKVGKKKAEDKIKKIKPSKKNYDFNFGCYPISKSR